jgi:hypothetical protein
VIASLFLQKAVGRPRPFIHPYLSGLLLHRDGVSLPVAGIKAFLTNFPAIASTLAWAALGLHEVTVRTLFSFNA